MTAVVCKYKFEYKKYLRNNKSFSGEKLNKNNTVHINSITSLKENKFDGLTVTGSGNDLIKDERYFKALFEAMDKNLQVSEYWSKP